MAQVKDFNPFGPGLLKFLRDLDRNNDRAWFEANKDRYEEEVREPGLAFIRIMAGHVHKISPHLIASDKRVGGSMMRIYRDVRFSKNLPRRPLLEEQGPVQDQPRDPVPPRRRQGHPRPGALLSRRAEAVLPRVRDVAPGPEEPGRRA